MTYYEAKEFSSKVTSFCGRGEYPWIYKTITTLPLKEEDLYVLEIGAFLGAGTVIMAAACDERFKYNRGNWRVLSMDTFCTGIPGTTQFEREKPRKDYINTWMELMKLSGFYGTRTAPLIADSKSYLPYLRQNKAAFIWVDGDHDDTAVEDMRIGKELLAIGGVIACHDAREERGVVRGIAEQLDADSRFELCHPVIEYSEEFTAHRRIG